MALDHKQAAREILEAVGGPGNIVSAAHCATRLRLVVADDSKVDKAKVDDAVGAKGSFQASGQLQVIYGTGTVNKVFDEFIALAGISASTKDETKAAAAAKANPFQRAIKALGDVFVPIIPAIVASGLLMWECPNVARIDGKEFLLVCPQGVPKRPFSFENIHNSGYFPIKGTLVNLLSQDSGLMVTMDHRGLPESGDLFWCVYAGRRDVHDYAHSHQEILDTWRWARRPR